VGHALDVIIAGGSAAGLFAGLLLARAGHQVLVLERDCLQPAPDVESAAAAAFRPTAPQIVQPHIVMARCRQLLIEHLPDVYAGLLAADLVIDATGRRSPIDDWLTQIGARTTATWRAECGMAYFSRHYRVRPGADLPAPLVTRTVVALDEFLVGRWGGDNGAVQLVVAPLAADHRFRTAREPRVFTEVLRMIPACAAWRWPYPAPPTWSMPSVRTPPIPPRRRSPWTASSARTWCRSTPIRP
jgi:hypothetical protein